MADPMEFQNASVVDGTGAPAFTGHVLVDGETIRQVGTEPVGADQIVDLDDAYLAPGFVDMHAHSELRLLDRPDAPEKITQGSLSK